MDLLLMQGLDIEARNDDGDTPLLAAVAGNHTVIAEYLIKHGAATNVRNYDGKTPLMLAVINQNRLIVNKILEKSRLSIASTDKDGKTAFKDKKTALVYAMEQYKEGDPKIYYNDPIRKSRNIIMDLLEEKVNWQDEDGKTALMYAVENGLEDVVKWLINRKADVNLKDKNGKTALMYAVENGLENVVKWLINRKADVILKDTVLGYGALDYALDKKNTRIEKLLRDAGAEQQDPLSGDGFKTALSVVAKGLHDEKSRK